MAQLKGLICLQVRPFFYISKFKIRLTLLIAAAECQSAANRLIMFNLVFGLCF